MLPIFTLVSYDSIDIKPPVFARASECQNGIDIRKKTLPGKHYADVKFEAIGIQDNSDVLPVVICQYRNNQFCSYELGKNYSFGITSRNGVDIFFKATDAAGNFRRCRFNVIVQG